MAFAAELLRLWRERSDNPLVVYGAPWKRGPGFSAMYFGLLAAHAVLVSTAIALQGSPTDAFAVSVTLGSLFLAPVPLYVRLFSWSWWDRDRLQEWALTQLPAREIVFGAYFWGAVHALLQFAIALAAALFAYGWHGAEWLRLVPGGDPYIRLQLGEALATLVWTIAAMLVLVAVCVRANVLMGASWVRAHLYAIVAAGIVGGMSALIAMAAFMQVLGIARVVRILYGQAYNFFEGGNPLGLAEAPALAIGSFALALLLAARFVREALSGLEPAVLRPIDPDQGHRGFWWARESAVKARLGRRVNAEARAGLAALLSRTRFWMGLLVIAGVVSATVLGLVIARDDKVGEVGFFMMHACFVMIAPLVACGCGWVARRVSGGAAPMVSGRTMKSLWAHAFVPVAALALGAIASLLLAVAEGGTTMPEEVLFAAVTALVEAAIAFLTLPIAYLFGLIPGMARARFLLAVATLSCPAILLAEFDALEPIFAALATTLAVYATLFARANATLQEWQRESASDVPADCLTTVTASAPDRPVIPDTA